LPAGRLFFSDLHMLFQDNGKRVAWMSS
jgi:hypothetical protein